MRKRARTAKFNVDAYTARLIGRENVSKLEGAVLEIVKNAYDADARAFCLYYQNSKNCVYILDNGTGMDESVIRTNWMTIGNSTKRENYLSDSGKRIQTGAKGIGRFALDRISDKCNMLTISKSGGIEWRVNWNDFDGKKKISDVKAKIYDTDEKLLEYLDIDNWENQEAADLVKKLNFDGRGTAFQLEGLHDDWNEKTMLGLRNHLENLLPPNVVDDFKILFFDDKTKGKNAEVTSDDIDSFDYKLEFHVQKDKLKIQIIRNEFDFRGEEETVYKEAGFDKEEQEYFSGKVKENIFSLQEVIQGQNRIGDFNGTLYFYKVSSTKKDQEKFYYKEVFERTNFTKKFGGIKIYRDKFRVRPYGEAGDNDFDWLELASRKNRSPAGLGHHTGNWRVSADQMMGTVYISRTNTNLDDSANRNGIQDGIGLWQLKEILLFVIAEFERDRQFVGRKLARYWDKKCKLAAELENMRKLADERRKWEQEQKRADQNVNKENDGKGEMQQSAPTVNPEKVEQLLNDLEERQEQELQDLRDENKMLQTLATTGIITNMFMHEIRTLTNNIGQELDSAYEAIVFDSNTDLALQNIKQAIIFKKNFASWFGITIDSIKKDKRKRKKYNIADMLNNFMETWKKVLEDSNYVDLHYYCDPDIDFWCFEFDVENIISNLISNSLSSFEREMNAVLKKKEISLIISKTDGGLLLDYQDSGWGLIPRYKARPELILEAFESGRTIIGQDEEGTGMGMWIVNRTVSEYNGTINLNENKETEQGFYIKIELGGRNV